MNTLKMGGGISLLHVLRLNRTQFLILYFIYIGHRKLRLKERKISKNLTKE